MGWRLFPARLADIATTLDEGLAWIGHSDDPQVPQGYSSGSCALAICLHEERG